MSVLSRVLFLFTSQCPWVSWRRGAGCPRRAQGLLWGRAAGSAPLVGPWAPALSPSELTEQVLSARGPGQMGHVGTSSRFRLLKQALCTTELQLLSWSPLCWPLAVCRGKGDVVTLVPTLPAAPGPMVPLVLDVSSVLAAVWKFTFIHVPLHV